MHDEGIGPIWDGKLKIYMGAVGQLFISCLFAYEHIYLLHREKHRKNMMVI